MPKASRMTALVRTAKALRVNSDIYANYARRAQSLGWLDDDSPGVTPWTSTGSPMLSKPHRYCAWGRACGHWVLSVGSWTLTQPWLLGVPKLLCHQAPWRAAPPSKYWVQGTCLMS